MKILLSPAKSLDFEKENKVPATTVAKFIDKSEYLVKKLQKFSSKKIGKMMHISPQLSDLNYERYQNWESPRELSDNVKPAATVFTGEVYRGLDFNSLSDKEKTKAQEDLRILSGLYGILKPLDLIFPYRLEMGTKWNVTPKQTNLYKFWDKKIAEELKSETEKDEVIINLASNEYFKVVQPKVLNRRIITPVFKELKGDEFKVVMMYAKHARGAMARDIIQQNYSSVEDLKGYNVDGYSYNESLSNEKEWVFVR